MQTTTDLTTLRAAPRRFTWGRILAFINVGTAYSFLEFEDRDGAVMFHIYVDEKDTSLAAHTLEEAMVLAIGYRNLGPNEGAAMGRAACRVLGIKPAR